MKRLTHLARALIWILPFVALLPLGPPVVDWIEVTRLIDSQPEGAAAYGYDWVLWEEDEDGFIVAAYVFPGSPADEAGIRPGDQFQALEYQYIFDISVLNRAIAGISPGETRTYTVQRDGGPVTARVSFTRYPTFLYPISTPLWRFALWGFAIGAFFHLLGLVIAVPLAARSAKARYALLLIGVSSLWVFGNLLRLLMLELFGPPEVGSTADQIFQGLTLVGLTGWIAFPVLLLHQVLDEVHLLGHTRPERSRLLIYLPPAVLGTAALYTTMIGPIGPIPLGELLVPILFYASIYIAAAAALMVGFKVAARGTSPPLEGATEAWNLTGSAVILVVALVTALSVQGIVPLFGVLSDTMAGWLIVGAQLLSVAPIILVSVATLKHGKVDQVLTRGLTYLTVLGLIFFVFVGGISLIEPYLDRVAAPRNVVLGLYVLVLLIVFERLARLARFYLAQFFLTDRQRARQKLIRFQEQMRNFIDQETLVQRTVEVVGETLEARSAILFLCPLGPAGPWLSSTYHPAPPYLTQRMVQSIWPHMEAEGRIWARNPELSESTLPPDLTRLLLERGAALAVPVMGQSKPIGLLVLGQKLTRRAVYNLEDLDLLRSVSGQLALAIERLILVERETMLARQHAEAQLVALRAQINPHFLFNALNTIISLIEERPEDAETTVEHLASIFRHILKTGGRAFVPLEDELTLVNHYLGIEQARFGAKLDVKQHLDPEVRLHPVPAFAVQTLVENAVKHGLEPQRGGGVLEIECRAVAPEGAEVVVRDTGVGIPSLFGPDDSPDTDFYGIGLKNVAARLEQLYGRPGLLTIRSRIGEGTTACIRLPGGAMDGLSLIGGHPATGEMHRSDA